MRWGELKPGDVIVHGPLEAWRHAWLVVSSEPDPEHVSCVMISIVNLDDPKKTTRHSRARDRGIDPSLGYDVLRGRELAKAGA